MPGAWVVAHIERRTPRRHHSLWRVIGDGAFMTMLNRKGRKTYCCPCSSHTPRYGISITWKVQGKPSWGRRTVLRLMRGLEGLADAAAVGDSSGSAMRRMMPGLGSPADKGNSGRRIGQGDSACQRRWLDKECDGNPGAASRYARFYRICQTDM